MILVTRVLGHCVFVFRSLPKRKKKNIIYVDLLSKVLEQESPGGEYEDKQGQQEEAVTGVLENKRHLHILPKPTARLNWSGKAERVLTDLNVLEINTSCLRKGIPEQQLLLREE